MTKGSKPTSRNPLTGTGGRAAITFGTRPPVSVVTTDKLTDAPLAREEFAKRLRRLQDLQRQAGEAILTFAVEYAALYDEVARQSARIEALHAALHLSDRAATRLRTIAAAASAFTSLQDRIPLALDVLYEVTLAHKEDPALVKNALDTGQITSESTLRDMRDFRRVTQANAREELDTLRRMERPDAAHQQRRAELERLNRKPDAARKARPKLKPTVAEFVRWLGNVIPKNAVMHSFAEPAVTIDVQFYGTTVIVERFVMTTVAQPYQATDGTWHLNLREDRERPNKITGTIPLAKGNISQDVLDAIRAIYGVDLSS